MHRLIILIFLSICTFQSNAANPIEILRSLPSSSLLLIDDNKQILETKNPNQPYIPASTIKNINIFNRITALGRRLSV